MGLALYLSRRARQDEPDNLPFEDPPASTNPNHRGAGYHPAWVRKAMPDPGAEAYAWTRLALMPFSTMAIGTGTEPASHFRATTPGMVALQTITLQGIPTISGAVRGQPLYDPQSRAFTGSVTGGVPQNVPHSRSYSGGILTPGLYP